MTSTKVKGKTHHSRGEPEGSTHNSGHEDARGVTVALEPRGGVDSREPKSAVISYAEGENPGTGEGGAVNRVTLWIAAGVFVVVFLLLLLSAWERVLRPSPHFHFIDLAESFMAGRLDTLTPYRLKGKPALPDDPEGLKEAVDRHLAEGGWNDWASYYEVVLPSGELFRGVWPWKDRKKGEKGYDMRNRFVTLSGDWLELDRNRELTSVCIDAPGPRAKTEERNSWQQRTRYEQQREACLSLVGEPALAPVRCEPGQRKVTCLTKRHFVSFPPMPALMMLPFVAIWHYNFKDVLFTLLLAALNATLLFLLLDKLRRVGYVNRTTRELLALVLLFSFGTVAWFCSIRGEVWYTALVIGVTFHILYLWLALDLTHPFLAGLVLALGVATRVPLAFASLLLLLQLILIRRPWDRSGILFRLRKGIAFAAPMLVIGGLLMLYNIFRFESPLEFGHRYLLEGTRASIVDHGLFSFWFLPKNLSVALTNVPQFVPEWPYVKISGHGLSILATTPVFLYLLWPRREGIRAATLGRYRFSLHTMLWITMGAVAMPGLLYQNTGWFQFGYRFVMDYLPLLIILLAMDSRKPGTLFYCLVGVSVLVNLFGAVTFGRFPQFYY